MVTEDVHSIVSYLALWLKVEILQIKMEQVVNQFTVKLLMMKTLP
jgi:hypothetical protein